ncbi:MAG TPA: hypothetical protein VND66_03815 [Acidobacteriaceae bacterium]|nr:hypothetical protein [Terriglobia bacterium]HVC89729.1 hypothetical protein [Acidobacteriaceae bacterium]
MSTTAITPIPLTPPIVRRIRAYFAPVNRTAGIPAIFDPAQNGGFNLDAPPAPWLDLGWLDAFERKTGTKVIPLRSGAPGLPLSQVRTEIDSLVFINFMNWGKLQMAVTAGSEQMNLLATTAGAAANGSGGTGGAAVPLSVGSTATFLNVAANQLSAFSPGQMVTVDVDYAGQTGYVGSGVSSAYVSSPSAVNSDVNYIRRISFNVARITTVTATGLQLAQPLIAGAPVAGMSVQPILGFVDREGSNFFQEWSGLFVIPGEQGDRILLHYPRLQIASSATEAVRLLNAPLSKVDTLGRVTQVAQFRALPVTDANDGAQVVCFRSYIPAAAANLW